MIQQRIYQKKILKEEHRIYPEVIRDIVNNKIIIEDRKVIRK